MELRHSLTHARGLLVGAPAKMGVGLQVKEGKLTGTTTMFVNEPTSEITSKDCTQIIIGHLDRVSGPLEELEQRHLDVDTQNAEDSRVQ